MDPGVGIILFGGVVLACVLVLISHLNGQAKIEREKKERAKREAEFEAWEAQCEAEDAAERRHNERYGKRELAWKIEAAQRQEKEDARRHRREHHVTRNVLRQATEKRKARRLYPAGLVK